MQIFLARNNVQAGPYNLEQLNIMLASGEVVLDDLMWHEGLEQWQRVGTLTNNQTVYTPAPVNGAEVNDSIINNVTIFPEDNASGKQTDKPVSLDRLYGKPERKDTANNTKVDMTTNRHHTPHHNVLLNKTQLNKAATNQDKVVGDVVLAPIMSRVLATVINALVYILASIPMIMAWSKLDIDYSKLQNIESVETLNKALEYSTSLIETIPSSTLMMSQALIFGLLALQLIFISLRGQSLGKLLTGIRVVDQTTHTLPSFTKLIAVRTLLLLIIYYLLFMILGFFAFAIIGVHYYMALKSPENIGWHDKLAKTLVVKADSSQLVKEPKIK